MILQKVNQFLWNFIYSSIFYRISRSNYCLLPFFRRSPKSLLKVVYFFWNFIHSPIFYCIWRSNYCLLPFVHHSSQTLQKVVCFLWNFHPYHCFCFFSRNWSGGKQRLFRSWRKTSKKMYLHVLKKKNEYHTRAKMFADGRTLKPIKGDTCIISLESIHKYFANLEIDGKTDNWWFRFIKNAKKILLLKYYKFYSVRIFTTSRIDFGKK